MSADTVALAVAWATLGVSVALTASMLRTLRDESREAFRGIRVVWPWTPR